MSAAKPSIYPIHLSAPLAEGLVKSYAAEEWINEASWRSGRVEFSFGATLHENGDVKVWVGHYYDSGYVITSGSLFDKVIRPFSADEIANHVEAEKLRLATVEYLKRKEAKERAAIMKIRDELFGKSA